jgi:hypothetical protein
MALGIKYGPRDWYLTKENTEKAIKAVESCHTINRKFDVPDLAGYSENGKTLYIDKDCPESFEYAGRQVKSDRYLLLHEEVEEALLEDEEEDSGSSNYLDCHQIACLAEKEAVETIEGMGCWEAYSKFCRKQIDLAWNKKGKLNTPPDLNKKPYLQQHEYAKLKQMGYIKQ